VVGRQGYANTSMKDIAAEAGVAQALLHYYFDSKDELLSEVVLTLDNELQDKWKAAVAPLTDPLERIAVGIDTAAATCAERPEFWRLLSDLQAVALTNSTVRARLRELSDRFLADVVTETENINRSLPTPAPMPVESLAEALVGAIDGIALAAVLREEDPKPAFQALKSMVLGLAALSYLVAGEPPPIEKLTALLQPQVPA
jgi:AcrR family transcriptional regulator